MWTKKPRPCPPFILPYFPTMYPCPLRCINSLPPPRSVSRTAAQSSIEKRTPKVQSKRARRRTVDVGAVLVLERRLEDEGRTDGDAPPQRDLRRPAPPAPHPKR